MATTRRRKSPQQKKTESLKKDRRNNYGENSKSSRKAIPMRKRIASRANRRSEHAALDQPVNSESLEALEEKNPATVPNKRWKKVPDIPLKEFLEKQQTRSSARQNRKHRRSE